MKRKRTPLRFIGEAIMIALSIAILAPLVYMILGSFKTPAEANRPLSFPSGLYVENYVEAIVEGHFFALFRNSVFVLALTLIVVIVVGSLASYPIARRRARAYRIVYFFFLSGIMIPFQAGMIPLYKLMQALGLIDSLFALVLINAGVTIPMAVLIFTGFLRTVPVELEESAEIDGCGILRTFGQIVFPLLAPATVAVVLISMIPIWNDFLTPLLFISSTLKKTLPLGMYNFMGERMVSYGPIYALSTLACIIPIVVFLILQKSLYKGIAAGAIKG